MHHQHDASPASPTHGLPRELLLRGLPQQGPPRRSSYPVGGLMPVVSCCCSPTGTSKRAPLTPSLTHMALNVEPRPPGPPPPSLLPQELLLLIYEHLKASALHGAAAALAKEASLAK
eukprot:305634-Chlamydomonas_euryale.AAC.1